MQQLLLWLSFPFPLFFLSDFFFFSQIGVSFTMATPLGFTLAVNDSLYIPSCWWANRSRAQALFVEIPTCVWIETVGLARVMTGVGNVGGRTPGFFLSTLVHEKIELVNIFFVGTSIWSRKGMFPTEWSSCILIPH